jgi:hypothetical protein
LAVDRSALIFKPIKPALDRRQFAADENFADSLDLAGGVEG